jgi:hypothetical protein
MDEESLSTLMHGAAGGIDVPAAPLDTIESRGRRRRRNQQLGGMAGVAAVTALAIGVGVVVAGNDSSPAPPATSSSCVGDLTPSVLPEWARAGFSDPEPQMPYVLGEDGSIAAILFGQPLESGDSPEATNKVLWVAKEPWEGPTDLVIHAHLEGSDTLVKQVVPGGPGPSGIVMPQAGCWEMDLAWADRTDTVWLRYE